MASRTKIILNIHFYVKQCVYRKNGNRKLNSTHFHSLTFDLEIVTRYGKDWGGNNNLNGGEGM